jgi:hypothetical protein
MITFRLAATKAQAVQFIMPFRFGDLDYPAGSWIVFGSTFSRFACTNWDAQKLFAASEVA